MRRAQLLASAAVFFPTLFIAACGTGSTPMSPTPAPLPPVDPPIANVYILPDAAAMGANAFGDETIVIFKGERMRVRNFDSVAHTLVPDTSALPEFDGTGPLAPGDERSFLMTTTGTTTFRCTEHPQMVGTLVVRDR